MSDMREALVRAGLVPSTRTTADPAYGERSAVIYADAKSLTDKQVIDELTTMRASVADIERQLHDDKEDGLLRGDTWRMRARRASRGQKLRVDQLEGEAKSRGLVAAFPDLVQKMLEASLRAQAVEDQQKAAMERKEAKITAHAARALETETQKIEAWKQKQASHQARDDGRFRFFVKAAYQIHSRDVCDRIWRRAKEMFPGSDAWANPTSPKREGAE